jgi:hypothetical protein
MFFTQVVSRILPGSLELTNRVAGIEGFSMGKVTVLDGGFNGKMPMWKITRGYT